MYKQSKLIVKALDEDVCVYVKDSVILGTIATIAVIFMCFNAWLLKLILQLMLGTKMSMNVDMYINEDSAIPYVLLTIGKD